MADEPARRVAPGPPSPRAAFERFLITFVFILMLMVIVFPDMREGFGTAAALVFDPLIGFDGHHAVLSILLAGMLTTAISTVLRHVFTDWISMARFNKIRGHLQKEQMAALKKGNQKRIERIRKVQADLMPEMMKIQLSPMKSMAYYFIIIIAVFAWLAVFVDGLSVAGRAHFAVPWSFKVHLNDVFVFPAWILLYGLLAVPFQQVLTRALKWATFQKRLAALEGAPAG